MQQVAAVKRWRFHRQLVAVRVEHHAPGCPGRRCRQRHCDLGLFGVGTAGGPKRRGAIGLYHLAWQLDTIDELAAARDALQDAGAFTGQSSHGATKSLYGADPDGKEFEIMWMLPRKAWGDYENTAPVDHLDLAGELPLWSGVPTAGELAASWEGIGS